MGKPLSLNLSANNSVVDNIYVASKLFTEYNKASNKGIIAKANTIFGIVTAFHYTVKYGEPIRDQPIAIEMMDDMIDAVLFDNGYKVLDPREQEQLISQINLIKGDVNNDDMMTIVKALCISVINKFYNSFRE